MIFLTILLKVFVDAEHFDAKQYQPQNTHISDTQLSVSFKLLYHTRLIVWEQFWLC